MSRIIGFRCVLRRTLKVAAKGLTVILASFFVANAGAQPQAPEQGPPPSFEVATIRPSRVDGGLENYQVSNVRLHVENAPLTALIRFAFDIRSDDQLPKEPSWIASKKFDIDAKVDDADVEAMRKMPSDKKLGQYRLMMQALLKERFQLRISTHSKELPVYALVVAKGGPKLAPTITAQAAAAEQTPTLAGGSRGALQAESVSMKLFAQWLSGRGDLGNRVVIDATGLTGTYDFTLNWTPENLRNTEPTGAVDLSGLSIVTALQEQLGLKLESRKAPVEVLEIDHVEPPTPN